jgi:pyruvate kinase
MKIVATLGPATSDLERIDALFRAGADVFRLNFSHGAQEDHARNVESIRRVEKKLGRPIAILADMQGPKLRVGRFAAGHVVLQWGRAFRLDLSPQPGDGSRVQLPHPEIMAAATVGYSLLLDDGRIQLEVVRQTPEYLETRVTVGGRLSDRKGVNLPGAILPIPALTVKDRSDLAFALNCGVDYIGLSFVQRPEDVAEARELVGGRALLMSKIEKPQALEKLDEIFQLSDAVMVARGDLGVELPPEDVPLIQKRVIRATRAAMRPTPEKSSADAISVAARQVAETIEASVIVAFTTSGVTALRIARQRPDCVILGLTPSSETARRLALPWGVHPLVCEGTFTMTETVAMATQLSSRAGISRRGDEIVVVAGVPFGKSGGTNSLRVARVGAVSRD